MPRTPSKPSAAQPTAMTLSEREIWTDALNMIRRYGRDAAGEARQRLNIFASEDELDGQLAWLRIIEAISWLQDDQPRRPHVVH